MWFGCCDAGILGRDDLTAVAAVHLRQRKQQQLLKAAVL
jgi:hypothetical protein